MTVAELIEELRRQDRDLEVIVDAGMLGERDVDGVELAEGSPDDDEAPAVILTTSSRDS